MSFKSVAGLPLEESVLLERRLLDYEHVNRLRALSVTTVEELLGLIQAGSTEMYAFLGGIDLAQLQADADPDSVMAIMAAEDELQDLHMALGAVPPDQVEIEEVASFDTYEQYAKEQPVEPKSDRSANLLGCFGPVRHQGDRPTCVAHAGGALAECLHHHTYGPSISFSPQFLYYQAKQRDGAPDRPGTWSRTALPSLLDAGISEESYWVYEPNEVDGDPTHGIPPAPAVANALLHRATRIDELNPRSSSEIRSVLDGGRPVSMSVPVYSTWWSTTARQFGEITMPVPTSRLEGGHAVCLAGYEWDAQFTGGGYFIFRNSWGTAWARNSPIEAGYGVIPFEYIDRFGWEAYTARLTS